MENGSSAYLTSGAPTVEENLLLLFVVFSDSMVGKTISHYKVLEKIGQGGMGEVFLAQDRTLDRKVALKFLPEEMDEFLQKT